MEGVPVETKLFGISDNHSPVSTSATGACSYFGFEGKLA
jgi:hypothetical protein